MISDVKRIVVIGFLSVFPATALSAEGPSAEPSPMAESIHDGSNHMRRMFTVAAEQMSEDDYAFRPTADVRSFGELLAHVAQTNYWFCSTAMGEKPPANAGKHADRAGTQKLLLESFEYCESAYASMSDEANAARMVEFMGRSRPALVVLNFRNYHGLLHWGNAITYMRLRGKVPPSN